MMGLTKLSEIKAVLERAFKEDSGDAIQSLEQRIRNLQQSNGKKSQSTKTLESLLRVLKGATTKKRRKRRAAKARS